MAHTWLSNGAVFLTGLLAGGLGGMIAQKSPAQEPFGDTTQRALPAFTGQAGGMRGPPPLVSAAIGVVVPRHRKEHCSRFVRGRLAVELGTAMAFVACYRRFGLGLPGILHMIIGWHLCILAGTDIMYTMLPNKILLSASGCALLLRLSWWLLQPRHNGMWQAQGWQEQGWRLHGWQGQVWEILIDGFLGACIGFGFLFAASLITPGAIGGGDVKMAGMIGLYLGFPGIVSGMAVGLALAALYTVSMLLIGRLKATDSIPLGVFLSIGTIWTAVAHPV